MEWEQAQFNLLTVGGVLALMITLFFDFDRVDGPDPYLFRHG